VGNSAGRIVVLAGEKSGLRILDEGGRTRELEQGKISTVLKKLGVGWVFETQRWWIRSRENKIKDNLRTRVPEGGGSIKGHQRRGKNEEELAVIRQDKFWGALLEVFPGKGYGAKATAVIPLPVDRGKDPGKPLGVRLPKLKRV